MPDLEKPNTDTPYIYTIEEILAPTGYIKGEEPIQLTVTFGDTGNVQTATPNANGIANIINEDNTIELKVQNTTKEAELEKEVFNLVLNKVDEVSKEELNYGNIIVKCQLTDCIKMDDDYVDKIKKEDRNNFITGIYEKGR